MAIHSLDFESHLLFASLTVTPGWLIKSRDGQSQETCSHELKELVLLQDMKFQKGFPRCKLHAAASRKKSWESCLLVERAVHGQGLCCCCLGALVVSVCVQSYGL